MPTIDEAIERAARAIRDFDEPGEELATQYAKAVLSAFLADVPVSEGMVEAGFVGSRLSANPLTDAFKAMCAKLAEEIQ